MLGTALSSRKSKSRFHLWRPLLEKLEDRTTPSAFNFTENFNAAGTSSTWQGRNFAGLTGHPNAMPAPFETGPDSLSTGEFLRLKEFTASGFQRSYNAMSFAPVDSHPMDHIVLDFDFRITAGGTRVRGSGPDFNCADGFSVAFMNTAVYGTSGVPFPLTENGVTAGGSTGPAFHQSFAVGFNTFDNGEGSNNSLNLNWNGSYLSNPGARVNLNNPPFAPFDIVTGSNRIRGPFQHVHLDLTLGTHPEVTMTMTTATGVTITPYNHFDLSAIVVNGLPITPYNSRLVFSTRTGDSQESVDLDNIVAQFTTVNQAPTANPGGPYSVPEGDSIVLNGAGSSDPDGSISAYQWDFNYVAPTFDADATGVAPTFSAAGLDGPASRTIALRVIDNQGATSSVVTTALNVANVLPSGSADNDTVTANEGEVAANTGTYSDPGDPVALSASAGTVIDTSGGTWSWSVATSDGPDDSRTVTIYGDDGDGDGAVPIATFDLVVNNVAPSGTADIGTVTVNEGVTAANTGTYSDPGDPVALSTSAGTVIDTGGGTWSWSFATSDGPDDSRTVTIYGDDGDVAVPIATFDLVVNNVAPSGTADNGTVTVNEGDVAANTGTYSDPGDPVALSASAGTVIDTGGGTWSWSFATSDGPDDSRTVTIYGDDGDVAVPIATFDLVVNNVAPSGTADQATVTVNAGNTAGNTGHYSDPADPVILSTSVGTVLDAGGGTWSWSLATMGSTASQTVTIFGDDGAGAAPIASFDLVVNNPVQTVALSIGPGQINLNGNGVFPVHILSTPTFSVTSLDVQSLRLSGAAPVHYSFSDVDHDGDVDLVMLFRRKDFVDEYAAALLADLADGTLDSNHQDVQLTLTGKTTSGADILGAAVVDMFMTGQNLHDLLASLGY